MRAKAKEVEASSCSMRMRMVVGDEIDAREVAANHDKLAATQQGGWNSSLATGYAPRWCKQSRTGSLSPPFENMLNGHS